MHRLGFTNPKSFKNAYYGQKIEQIKFKNRGICRYIDFLKELSGLLKYGFLIEYYIEYYDKKQKENIEQLNIESLDSLKKEFVILLSKKEELDSRISSLLEKINNLEKGKNINGR